MKTNKEKKPAPFYFYLLTFLVPVLLFALIETGLRLADVGKSLPLFIETPEFPGHLVANPNIIQRYVSDRAKAPDVRPDAVFFPRAKSASTFRVVVQGGSTAAGFPYGRNASIQGMLNQRFKRLYPDQKIEIISTAMAAVNSYTLLDFVDEIIAQQPDLVLIYTGHNEYVGVMGVGSSFGASSNRAITLLLMQARKLRLFQALEMLFSDTPTKPSESEDRRTLMSKVVGKKSIPLGSPLYNAGVHQFENNLAAILGKYQRAGIPVVISTLVSNEQDQVPFSTIDSVRWDDYRNQLDKANNEPELARLMTKYMNIDDAATNYKLGLNHALLSQYEQAREYFQRARDLDQLRFRAPTDFNAIVRRVAERHNAVVADTEQLITDESTNGIVSSQHMLEHVHPNVRGYFLLAESFLMAIQRRQLIPASAQKFSAEQAWKDIPVSKVDVLNANYLIEKLTNDYPFVTTPKLVSPPDTSSLEGEALNVQNSGINWRDYRVELMRRYQAAQEGVEAARVAANSSDSMFNDGQLAFYAGQRYLEIKDYPLARYYLQRATRIDSTQRHYWLSLAQAYFHLGETQKSEEIMLSLKSTAS